VKITANEILARLWNLCSVLRIDGLSYHQYVSELAFVLFLKMAKETKREDELPAGYRWDDLISKNGVEQLRHYRAMLSRLGAAGSKRVQDIYANASTSLNQPQNLSALVRAVDDIDWFSVARHDREALGDLYESLLEKNATDRRGAGQYFTPRPLVESMVAMTEPRPGDVIVDPACGTGGFLLAADRYIRTNSGDLHGTSALRGIELVPETRRLALMNLALHDLQGNIVVGDTLSATGAELPKADVIVTNPPFGGTGSNTKPLRNGLVLGPSNTQLAFVKYVYNGLKPRGRAAMVVTDGVLSGKGVGKKIRAELMDRCNLHTVLRLPPGIFAAQGVKTNVLFFTRGEKDTDNTKEIWFYDMRSNGLDLSRRAPLTRQHFAEFEKGFSDDANTQATRRQRSGDGRWRMFSREQIRAQHENLDVHWPSAADSQAEPPTLKELVTRIESARSPDEKGRALEALVATLFAGIPGFEVQRRTRTVTEEIDITVLNGSDDHRFRREEAFIVIECKNWSTVCGKDELVVFKEKIANRSGRCSVGFLVSWNGFAATVKQEMLRGSRERPLVVPIDGEMLVRAVEQDNFFDVLGTAFNAAIFV
jgi:type I restriction enzyme M protein